MRRSNTGRQSFTGFTQRKASVEPSTGGTTHENQVVLAETPASRLENASLLSKGRGLGFTATTAWMRLNRPQLANRLPQGSQRANVQVFARGARDHGRQDLPKRIAGRSLRSRFAKRGEAPESQTPGRSSPSAARKPDVARRTSESFRKSPPSQTFGGVPSTSDSTITPSKSIASGRSTTSTPARFCTASTRLPDGTRSIESRFEWCAPAPITRSSCTTC